MKDNLALVFFGIVLISTVISCWADDSHMEGGHQNIRRFAFVVGKNDGGPGRQSLKYAATDARAFTKVMEELGGLDGRNAVVLLNPSRKEFLSRFRDVEDIVGRGKSKNARTELFLYYSGHSDDEGLLLDGERVTYRELKKEITRISADVSVVVLDSCASGSLTRVKGGVKRPPFLDDSLSKLKGYVVLTSSSAREAAQESDRVKGSFFTHYLVSGVRGAADVNSDSKVTLNEAYQYAFNHTLARTAKTLAGPQHPSYSIELAGSGELVMTDIRNTNSRIVLEDKLLGRFYFRDKDEKLVAEVDKYAPKPMSVGLEPGEYSVVSYRGGKIAGTSAKLGPNHALKLVGADFHNLEGEANAVRGDASDLEYDIAEDLVSIPAEFSVMPDVSTNIFEQDRTTNSFHLSLLNARSAKLTGAQITLLGFNRVRRSVVGAQIAPGANLIDSGPMTGAQIAAGYNLATKVTGMQAGGYNRSADLVGAQIGGLSVAENVVGAQIGAANFSRTGMDGSQIGAFNRVQAAGRGWQVGGANEAQSEFSGAQVGAGNYANGRLQGAQIGALNLANTIEGLQIGIANVADEMKGVQFGIYNRSRGTGSVPIGLVNVVENGMYRVGYGFSEKGFHQVQFRHGSENAYSIAQYGRRAGGADSETLHLFGLGFGGQWCWDRALFGIEGAFSYVNKTSTFDSPAWLTQVRLMPGWRITRAISVTAGPTFNHVFKSTGRVNLPGFNPEKEAWIGYHAGLEFWL